MRMTFTVRDGRGGYPDVEVLLDAEPVTPLREVIPLLASVLGEDIHPSFAARLLVWVDGRRAGPDDSLHDAGLREGSLVSLYADAGPPPALPAGVAELRVVAGLGAGRVHRLGLGRTPVGCGADGFSLADVRIPADGLSLLARPDGQVEITPATHLPEGLPVALDGHREAWDATVVWPRGACLRLGDTVLQLVDVSSGDAETTRSPDGAGVEFHRPPRLLPATRGASVSVPSAPPDPPKRAFPWLVVAAPLALAVPMAVLSSPRYLIFALMSPLMMLANVVNDRRSGRREHRTRLATYLRERGEARADLDRSLRGEEHRRRDEAPDPATLLLTALGPGRRLWQRRRRDEDFLALRVGVADRPAQLTVVSPPGAVAGPRANSHAGTGGDTDSDVADDEFSAPVAREVPVILDLRRLGVVGLAGDPQLAHALACWLVVQACVLHSPRDLRLVLLTDGSPDADQRWGWVGRLPHARPDDLPVTPAGGDGAQARPIALVGNDQETVAHRLAELTAVVGQRLAERATAVGARSLTPAPDLLVVLSGARRLRTLPGVVALLRDGPAAGVHLLCLEEEERALPEECKAVVACGAGTLTVRQTKTDPISGVTPDAVEPAWVAQVARALAPLRDGSPDEEDAALPSSVRLLDRLRMDPPGPEAVLDRWRGGGSTAVVVGAGFDGDFRLDLRRDGPHALVAGTTGAGKSEFLQTLVASLAVANPPEALTFVLVDYKGGSAFRECARLPHTVGMVTDLDAHLVTRALESLGAELKRRERLLADAAAKDLEDYTALRARAGSDLPPIPRLVIVIDEFAGLVAELPDFVPGLVGIAQRGRSLGIHLVLATQRPTGVVSAEIRANTALRICLRVTDDAESRDVIDAPDAARIPSSAPGRGLARTGHSSLLPFQSGRVGGRRPNRVTLAGNRPGARRRPGTGTGTGTMPATDRPLIWPLPWDRLGAPAPQRPRDPGIATDEGDTDLSDLVTAIRTAAATSHAAAQHSPWLPPLPDVLTMDELLDPADADQTLADPEPPAAWALMDLPAEQAQRPCTFRLGASGHLYVVGGPRSGRTTALRTLIAALARRAPARDLHVYGLDCGNGGLQALADLPHCGAVVSRTATERANRLVRRIHDEVARRQELLADAGYADIDEQRATAAPDQRLPHLILAIDRWEGFISTLGELDGGRLTDDVMGLLREGASVGLHVLISGDRSLLLGRIGALVEHKLLLHLPDRNDYALAGIAVRDVPEHLPPGRGVWADTAIETQVAVLSTDPTGTGQAAAIRTLADTTGPRDEATPAHLRPARLGALPALVAARLILDTIDTAHGVDGGTNLTRPPLWVPLGVGGDDLDLHGLDLGAAPIAVIAGPPRSGRTAALRFALAVATRRGQPALAICPRGGMLAAEALSEQGSAALFAGADADADGVGSAAALVARLRDLPPHSLVLIDDAEMLRDGDLAPVLLALTRQAREKSWGVLVAGDTAQLCTGLSGWLFEARRARQGLLLAPRTLGDGEALGIRLAPSQLTTRLLPGRGLLVGAGDGAITVQVPWSDNAAEGFG